MTGVARPGSSGALPDPARVRVHRRIEWIDTDAAGVYHWSTVIRLMEVAEAALHTALGIDPITFGAMPRISMDFQFRSVLRFNDVVEVDLRVESLGRSTICYEVELAGPGGVAADGHVKACFVDRASFSPVPWPDDVRRLLTAGGEQEA
jgi:acyl-CoA thioesterase FadM